MALATLCCRTEAPAPETGSRRSNTVSDAAVEQGRRVGAEERALGLGPAVERQLVGGERHVYTLELAADDYLHLVVEQQGVDLVAALAGPGGEVLLEVDSPTADRGPETIFLVVPAAGRYRLEVRGAPGAAHGGYAVRIEARRPATAPDRQRAAALEAFACAENLRRERTPEASRAALEPYRDAARRWAAVGDAAREALALGQIGKMYEALGENRQAIDWYRRSVERWRSSGAAGAQLASILRRLSTLHRNLGEEEAALDSVEAALELARQLGDGRREASGLNNLALIHKAFGHPQQAMEVYEQARQRWRELGHAHPGEEAQTLSNLGGLYSSLGSFERALILLEEALPLSRESGRRRVETFVLFRLGSVLTRLGRPREGLDHLQSSLALGVASRDRFGQAVALRELARTRFELGDSAAAVRLGERSLSLFRDLGQPRREAEVASDLGWFHTEAGDPERALAYLESALRRHRQAGYRRGEASALHVAARAERRRGDVQAARRRIEQAIEIVESLRTRSDVLALRSSYLAGKQDYYELYLDLLIELHDRDPAAGYDVLAFEASERRRARTLLDVLIGPRAALRRDAGPALEAEERALRRRLDALGLERRRRQRTGAAPAEVAALNRQLEELLMARERLRARTDLVPAAAPPALGLRQVQALLDQDTLLLEVALGETRSFLWAVTPDALRCHRLPPRSKIEALAREAYRLLAGSRDRRRRGRLRLVTAELSRMLLAPVAGRLASERLVVVSDGVLQHLPFAALPVPPAHPAAGGSGRMLEWHEVVHVPSLPVLAALRGRDREVPAGGLAVVADPVFEAGDPRIAAPAATLQPAGEPAPLRRLPATRDEAAAILALVPEAGRRAILGPDANRQMVASGVLGDYRLVHFATHGLSDPQRPELSGLALSRFDALGRPRDDWILRPHEIGTLDLAAEMVVLSACRSGLGREVRGEGLVGLTQAFLHAGAARVVVSFWPVDDRATAALMERFYRGILERGLRPAAALRSAQLSMLRETPWQAPYYWAGFFFQGEWRQVARGADQSSP